MWPAILLGLLAAMISTATAQTTVYPPVLYSGHNVLTINAPNGIRKITGFIGGRWTTLHTGLSAPYVKVTSAPMFANCAQRVRMSVYIMLTRPSRLFKLRVEDCRGNIKYFDFEASEQWNVYREQFGNVVLGSNVCHTFRVDANGTSVLIDSITSPSPLFQIRYSHGRPPLRLAPGSLYLYDVCFKPVKTGYVKAPIYVYLRRKYPAGGHNSFIVADTAYVNVVPKSGSIAAVRPPQPRPRPRPALIAQPKPIIIERPAPRPQPKPTPPADTLRIPPPVGYATARTIPMAPPPARPRADREETAPLAVETEAPITDPTTHRVVLMPTARSVDSGAFFISNYEIAGVLAGYGVTDRLTLLAGGLYVPPSISSNLVLTGGGRYELYREGYVRGAVGLQANYSRTDLSSILLFSPYAVLSLGDDDSRLTAALGYAWRRHVPNDNTKPFTRRAFAGGLGGDVRIARHWKIASEIYALEDASVQPLVATVRYFDTRFAVDVGVGVDLAISGGTDGRPRVAPIITATWTW